MLARTVGLASLIALVAAARPAAAQYRVHYGWNRPAAPTEPMITPYGGYMSLGHYVNGPLGNSVSGADASLVGVQVTLPLTQNVALVGNVGHANSSLVFNVPAGGGPTIGNSGVWLYDGDLQLSSPFRGAGGHWVNPFIQVGAGAIRYATQNTLGSTSATNFAFNAGLGLDYYLARNIGLRILAKDYVGHWTFVPAAPFESGDRFTDNLSITGGLNIGL